MKQHTHALAGQLYVDNVADNAKALAVKAVASHVRQVKAAIKGATSFADAKKRLRAAHAKSDPKKLAKVLQRAIVMSELAGRRAIHHEHT